eukprot:scaffold678389_cov64-Prasinocladus_malaysianus.AAC.1
MRPPINGQMCGIESSLLSTACAGEFSSRKPAGLPEDGKTSAGMATAVSDSSSPARLWALSPHHAIVR